MKIHFNGNKYCRLIAAVLCVCCALCGCSTTIGNVPVSPESAPSSDIADMTRAELGAEVGDNFYAYVNFERLKSEEIPYGEVYKLSEEDWTEAALERELQTILENKNAHKYGSNEQKIADCYEQYFDVEARNDAGIAPLEGILDEINSAVSIEELIEVCAKMQWDLGCGTIFYIVIDSDHFNSDKYGLTLVQMQMPVYREELLTSYGVAEDMQIAIENVLEKRGAEDSEQRALALTDMLIDIAERSTPEDELFYNIGGYRKMSLEELSEAFKNADIGGFTARLKSCGANEIVVLDHGQVEAIAEYLKTENLTLWKDYLTVQLLCFCMEILPEEYARLLAPIGAQTSAPTEKQVRESVLYEFSREMAFIFSEEYADESVIQAAKELTRDVIDAYQDMISGAEKVDDETKQKFLKKLENMQINIDVPDAPYDGGYEWIPAKNGGGLLSNMLAKRAGEFKSSLGNLGKTFDKSAFDWNGMPPQTYGNASYSMSNYVTIPYATLTAPYFDATGNYYKNLGYLGMIIGHEISHGFDSSGMCFDENGNLGDWLSDEYSEYLEEKKSRITELYNGYKLFGTYPLDGAKTLGENMADLAGVQCMLSMAKTAEEKRIVLESYAENWYMLIYDDVAYKQLYSDVHSLNEFRTNVVVSQMDEFYEVYDIDENDAMYTVAEKRERVWE